MTADLPPLTPEPAWVRISLVQHFAYCPRQAWLINDGVWQDNHLTVVGSAEHATVDDPGSTSRRGVRVHHRVELSSARYRIHGFADAVEEHRDGVLLPVEHKHGVGAGSLTPSLLQAVAQALCLTEMTKRPVPQVAVYVTRQRRRELFEVAPLVSDFESSLASLRRCLAEPLPSSFPPAGHCRRCSIREACLPPEQQVHG